MKLAKNDISGIVLLNKSLGISSNKALQKVKRIFNAKKAGHTGSLDPLASGMLPICLGEATKFSHYLLDSTKTYRAIAKLGVTSTTGDAEGEKTVVDENLSISPSFASEILKSFLGEHDQMNKCIYIYI